MCIHFSWLCFERIWIWPWTGGRVIPLLHLYYTQCSSSIHIILSCCFNLGLLSYIETSRHIIIFTWLSSIVSSNMVQNVNSIRVDTRMTRTRYRDKYMYTVYWLRNYSKSASCFSRNHSSKQIRSVHVERLAKWIYPLEWQYVCLCVCVCSCLSRSCSSFMFHDGILLHFIALRFVRIKTLPSYPSMTWKE